MKRRKFTRDFKLEAVKLMQARGATLAHAARDSGVHGTVLRRLVSDALVMAIWRWGTPNIMLHHPDRGRASIKVRRSSVSWPTTASPAA